MNKRKPSIEIYLTDEQKVTVKKAAADARLSISEFCLEMIFKGQVKAALAPHEIKLMSNLSGMANNLNQVVKRMHQEKESSERIDEVLSVINSIEKILG
jgi:hypothetical protein